MEIQQYIDRKKVIQSKILEFIDDESNAEEDYQNFINSINNIEIEKNSDELQSILYLISKISNNHHRSSNFFSKIEKILLFLQNFIQINLSNSQIFSIFKSSKRILLFLINEKIITVNSSIIDEMKNDRFKKRNYCQFFYPEIESFFQTDKKSIEKISSKNQDEFEKMRNIGENHSQICELIRNDSIEEFITFVNKNNYSLKSPIEKSIYETNSFLLKNKTSLIEYSAFFGSLQILKYFHLNGIELTQSLWIYAVHGDNPELIQYLIDNKITPKDESYQEVINESIKCHHNEIVDYIYNNILNSNYQSNYNNIVSIQSIKYYNYEFFPKELKNEFCFYYFCKYDHIKLVKILLNYSNLNINKKIIFYQFFFKSCFRKRTNHERNLIKI